MQDHHHLKIDIIRSSTPPVDDFRVNAIRSDYDYTVPEVTEHFTGETILPDDRQGIGLGRMLATTVAKHMSLQYDCFLQTSNTAMKHAPLHYDDWKPARNNINLVDRKHAIKYASTHGKNFSKASHRVKTASFVIRKHR